MLPFDLPPPPPIKAPAAPLPAMAQMPMLVAKETKQISMEEREFNKSVSAFQQHLKKLSPKHKAEMRKLHLEVTQWADKQRAAGQRADKLSNYVGQVMAYCDKHLANIEKADPELRQLKAEHKQFQDLFLAGNRVIEAYLRWIRTDYKTKKKKKKPKAAPKKAGP